MDAGTGQACGGQARGLPDEIEIRRSKRRRRSVSARIEADRVVVLMPDGLSKAVEQRHVDDVLAQLRRREQRKRLAHDDLPARATALSKTYLEGRAQPASITWVTNQGQRWGSCTPATGEIRISSAMEGMPSWVIDAVVVHELAHLLVPGHGQDFYAWVCNYTRYDEAQAFLNGVAWARRHP
ncbi:DUF45 domain-containing protein [Ornithinimicrobium sp. Arc0846-15]|nr:DUF45 domain-containing protein [Ornithinimicrobium laminariae]